MTRDTQTARPFGPASALFIMIAAWFAAPWSLVPGAGWAARWSTPEWALAVGIAVGLLGLTRFERQGRLAARLLIQVFVVLLGFRIAFDQVLRIGALGAVLGTGVIACAFGLGFALGRVLAAERVVTTLLCTGTGVCGGSAIAAVGSALRAPGPPMAVALGAVFVLNAVALYAMPLIADALSLSSRQFGTWAGLAIHDMSSVVAAASSWDVHHPPASPELRAEPAAAVTKLARVLWIVPLSVAASWASRRRVPADEPCTTRRWRSPVPWFIAAFLGASAVRTAWPGVERLGVPVGPGRLDIKTLAAMGMTLALFLIGAGLSRRTLAAVGWRAMALALTLWLVIGAASLAVVRSLVP